MYIEKGKCLHRLCLNEQTLTSLQRIDCVIVVTGVGRCVFSGSVTDQPSHLFHRSYYHTRASITIAHVMLHNRVTVGHVYIQYCLQHKCTRVFIKDTMFPSGKYI